jgi:hypothetical protein
MSATAWVTRVLAGPVMTGPEVRLTAALAALRMRGPVDLATQGRVDLNTTRQGVRSMRVPVDEDLTAQEAQLTMGPAAPHTPDRGDRVTPAREDRAIRVREAWQRTAPLQFADSLHSQAQEILGAAGRKPSTKKA